MEFSGLLIPVLAALGMFFLVYMTAGWIWNQRDPARRGVLEIAEGQLAADGGLDSGWRRVAAFGDRLLPIMGKERRRITDQLYLAGLRRSNGTALFVLSKVAMLLIAVSATWALWTFNTTLSQMQLTLASSILIVIALLIPNWWLQQQVKRRQAKLRNAFPDALDMLVICVEAGLGLTSAIERVTEEIRHMHPELATEFAAINAEIRSGVDRASALRSLNARTGLPEIRGFVSLLVQTLQLGTGIADALRIFAEEFRDQRMQRAEERAAKVGTKMIFPLVFCEFPVFFLIAVGPALLRLFDAFAS
jgi:tight adherence protein C